MHSATIYDANGETITQGLETCLRSDQALQAARNIAAERGEPVVLHDHDGWWTIAPDGEGTERKAPVHE
jgi:hypothetical protein